MPPKKAEPTPSFWDEYEDVGGGNFVKADEKTAIAENGIPMKVIAVLGDEHNTYEGAPSPRYVVVVELPNPETGEDEERRMGFPTGTGVDSRDRMLGQLAEYVGRDDATEVVVKLEKVGRSYILRQA